MAEISQPSQSSGKVRVRKRSTRIDMTPMVDLAFLLLTFFILTTTFNKTKVMELTMPDKPDPVSEPPEVSAKNALSIAIGEENKLYWWIGDDPIATPTTYSPKGIRQILLDHSTQNSSLVVLIKPHDKAKYENVVDILDEMSIVDVDRYAIVAFTEEDRNVIDRKTSQ